MRKPMMVGVVVGVLCAAPGSALAGTAVPGSKYVESFSGTGSENVSWQDGPGNPVQGESGTQTGTWTISDNNHPALWLPSESNPAEEQVQSSADSFHVQNPVGTPPMTPASLSETGMIQDPNTGTPTLAYSCSASSVYDNGIATVSAGVFLGKLAIQTNYDDIPNGGGRTFVAGSQLDGHFSCNQSGDDNIGTFQYPEPIGSALAGTQNIAYAGIIPFSSVGQSTITVPATDHSTLTNSAVCDGFDDICTSLHVSISGSYTLTKVCDGAVNYTASGLTGTCGQAPPPGVINSAHSAQASGNGTVTVGTSSCAGPGSCTDSTTVTNSGSGSHATKKIVYGHSKVTVAAGKTVKLKVTLTKKALKALKKAGKLKTTVTIVITSNGGKKVTKTFKLTIKAPKK